MKNQIPVLLIWQYESYELCHQRKSGATLLLRYVEIHLYLLSA